MVKRVKGSDPRKKQRLVLAIHATHEGETREVLRGFVSPETTVGDLAELEDQLNKVYRPVKFEQKYIWEDVP